MYVVGEQPKQEAAMFSARRTSRGMGWATLILALMLAMARPLRAEPRVDFGAYVMTDYIVFTITNHEDFDVQCTLTIRARFTYEPNGVGFRQISIVSTVLAKKVDFKEESGREIVQNLRTNFGTSVRYTDVDLTTATQTCSDEIKTLNYIGGMRLGKRDGQGTLTFADGSTYDGEWRNNKKNGSGKDSFADGDSYDGQFVDGERSGIGTYYSENGEKFVGNWAHNKENGFRTQTFPDGERYEGMFVDGEWSGPGTYYHKDGEKFVGNYLHDKANGMGKETYADGDSFDGQRTRMGTALTVSTSMMRGAVPERSTIRMEESLLETG
jgi:hypothetical protein